MARAALRDRGEAETLLGVHVPAGWPGEELIGILPDYVQELERDPSLLGWGVWVMVHRARWRIVGDLGFKGKPDINGTVEIGYSVLPEERRQGFATEGARTLVAWALAQPGVARIVAECVEDNIPSIRTLEKLGMQFRSASDGFLTWELGKPTGAG